MIYFDSSALVKLLLTEPESGALRAWVAPRAGDVQSSTVLARVEVARTVRTAAATGRLLPAALAATLRDGESLIDELSLVPLDAEVLREAAALPTPHLRSLDAIHVATAARYRTDLEAIVTYDARLVSAAAAAGLPTVSPS